MTDYRGCVGCPGLIEEVRALEAGNEELVINLAGGDRALTVIGRVLDRACAEIARLKAELELERSRYTLGGTPPGYHEPGAWHQEPVAPPPSASDESAPPLKRGLS